jgi:hypothetical protein
VLLTKNVHNSGVLFRSEVKTYNPSTDSTISPGAVSGKRKRKAVDIEDGEELHQEEQLGGLRALLMLTLVSDVWL